MSRKRIVMALGHKALGTNLPEQKKASQNMSRIIADLIQDGWQVALVHSNAPQVGMIHTAMNDFGKQHPGYTPAPMSVCSAMSQGYIGYDLQNAIRGELIRRGIYKPVSTILTQVTVDPYDEATHIPQKFIGRVLTDEEARAEEEKGNFVRWVEGQGFRRMVAAPRPVAIVEIDAIRALLNAGQIVIACGGGGIPVMVQGSSLKGASAVIEKDLTAGLLAREVDADVLMILTAVDNVTLNYGQENECPIYTMNLEQAKDYIAQGHFEFASMLPKVEAGVDFVEHGSGRRAVITSPERTAEALAGKAGTTILDS